MDLSAVLGLLRRRVVAIVLCLLVGLAAGVTVLQRSESQFRSQSQVLISLPGSDTTAEALQGLQISSQLLQSYSEIVSSRSLAQQVKDRLSLPESADAVRGKLSAAPKPQTLYIIIRAVDADPVRSRSITDAATTALIDRIATLESARSPEARVRATVLDPAVRGVKISPDPVYDVGVGALVGLLVGLALALVLDGLDRSVKTSAQVHALLGAPLLGSVPKIKGRPAVVAPMGKDPVAESYRALRTAVRFVNPDGQLTSFAVTSAGEGEGKTTTAANLAIALAESGASVVLVDADLRRATLARTLGLEGAVGLSDVIVGQAVLADVLQQWGGLLTVLPAGTLPPNPSELLGSEAMAQLLDALHERFEVIILDTPPALPVTDAVVLSSLIDGLVVVVRAGKTSRPTLSELHRRLETVKAPVLGAVLNATAADQQSYYDYRAPADRS